VEAIKDVTRSDIRINGGYFVFRKDIFKYMKDGEELLHEPFQRLVEQEQLLAYKYDGFWAAMDTFKDKQMLDDIHERGQAPWQVWNHSSEPRPSPRVNKPSARMVTSHVAVRR
jgi:glucose-1-phosphate cytidylyltransferase